MIKAKARTEQISKGQIGQPAACMMENKDDPCRKNPDPAAGQSDALAGAEQVNARDYGLKQRPLSSRVNLLGKQSTAAVDNFVGKPRHTGRRP
nr:hypothetical protein [uncultured Roseateles sp.]